MEMLCPINFLTNPSINFLSCDVMMSTSSWSKNISEYIIWIINHLVMKFAKVTDIEIK